MLWTSCILKAGAHTEALWLAGEQVFMRQLVELHGACLAIRFRNFGSCGRGVAGMLCGPFGAICGTAFEHWSQHLDGESVAGLRLNLVLSLSTLEKTGMAH